MIVSKHFYELFSKAALVRSIFFTINVTLLALVSFFPSITVIVVIGTVFNLVHGSMVFYEARRTTTMKSIQYPDNRYLAEYLAFFRYPKRHIFFYIFILFCYVGIAIFYKCAIMLSVGLAILLPLIAFIRYRKDTMYLYDIKHHLRGSELCQKKTKIKSNTK